MPESPLDPLDLARAKRAAANARRGAIPPDEPGWQAAYARDVPLLVAEVERLAAEVAAASGEAVPP